MARVFAVASAKGGVGKTTTTANVGAILAETGADVVVIDGDIGMANLGAALGVTSQTTIHDVLSGEAPVSQATVEGPGGVYVVPGDTALSAYADADPTELKSVLQTHSQADYVLIDVGAGISHESSLPLSLADEVLLVSTPDRDALLDTEKTRQLTEQLGGDVAGAVITRTEPTTPISELVTGTLGTSVLATIPEDEAVQESLAVGEPLLLYAPHSPAAAGYRKLVAELTGVEPPEPPEAAAESESDSEADSESETAATTEPDAATASDPDESAAVDPEPAPESPADMPAGATGEESETAGTSASEADTEPPAEAESKWAEAATGSGIDTDTDKESSTPEPDADSQSVGDDAIPFRDSAADDEAESDDSAAEPSDADSGADVDESEAVEMPDQPETAADSSADDSEGSADSNDGSVPSVESETVEIGETPDTSQDDDPEPDDGSVVIPDAEPDAGDDETSEAIDPSGTEEGAMKTELAAGESEEEEEEKKKGFFRRLFFG